MTASTQQVVTVAPLTPATGVVSLSVVAKRSGGTGPCTWIRFNGAGNRLSATSAVANGWNTFATSGLTTTAATDGVWHAGQGVNNGASSVIRIDATETTGTTGAATLTAGTMGTLGGTSATCDVAEAIVWDAVANDAATRAFLAGNQKSFWGTP